MDGHGGWSRSGFDRPEQPRGDAAGWYVDEGWQDETAEDDDLPEPSSAYASDPDGGHAAAGERYPDPPARRYDESRPDPLRGALPTELPRVTPSRPEPATSGPPARTPVGEGRPPTPTYPAASSAPPPVSPPSAPPVSPVPPPRAPMSAPQSPGPMGENIYRSKRPAALIGFSAVVLVLEIPALLLLVSATTADPIAVTGVVAAICLVCALPLAAAGLYAVATGAVRAAGPNSIQAWLRPPVAYLTVALVLFVAAGLAA